MSEHRSLPRTDHQISRRSLLLGGVTEPALAALPSCDSAGSPTSTGSLRTAGPSPSVGANVRVSHDRYREHVGPSVAANPRDPRRLLAACQASPATPESIVTYLSFDGGANWRDGGLPPQPAARPARDDLTVALHAHSPGSLCATRSSHRSPLNPSHPDAAPA